MNKVPMTVRGAELLREELKTLKSKSRPEIIQAIAEARAHGDTGLIDDRPVVRTSAKWCFGSRIEG